MSAITPNQEMPALSRIDQKRLRVLLRPIREASRAGKWKKADWQTVHFLRSFEAKQLAVRLAYKAMPPLARPNAGELDAFAADMDPWRGSVEAVFVNIQRKLNDPDDFRHVMIFGIENRALQYLLVLALRARAELHPSQHGLRGTHEAIKVVRRAMSDGYVWATEHDIKDFYPSINGKEVPNFLPLPKKVTKQVLIGEHLNLKAGPTIDSATRTTMIGSPSYSKTNS